MFDPTSRTRASKEKRQPSKPLEPIMRGEPNFVVACSTFAAPYDADGMAGTGTESKPRIARPWESPAASAIPFDSSNDAPTLRSCAARERRHSTGGRRDGERREQGEE